MSRRSRLLPLPAALSPDGPLPGLGEPGNGVRRDGRLASRVATPRCVAHGAERPLASA